MLSGLVNNNKVPSVSISEVPVQRVPNNFFCRTDQANVYKSSEIEIYRPAQKIFSQ